MYSSECRIREVTARMWRAAEDCSRSERQRLEKLDRRRLRVEYEEQTAREMKWNADAFETPTLLDDEVHRRDMTVPVREDIYKQERPSWSLSAKRSSARYVHVYMYLRFKIRRRYNLCATESLCYQIYFDSEQFMWPNIEEILLTMFLCLR